MLRAFTLPKADFERVREAGGPLAAEPDLSEAKENMAACVVEVDGRVVAYWALFYCLHAEPLWVHPDHRRNPGVIGGVIDAMLQEAFKTGEPAVFSLIKDENLDIVGSYAQRLGFQPDPGTLFYRILTPAPDPVEV